MCNIQFCFYLVQIKNTESRKRGVRFSGQLHFNEVFILVLSLQSCLSPQRLPILPGLELSGDMVFPFDLPCACRMGEKERISFLPEELPWCPSSHQCLSGFCLRHQYNLKQDKTDGQISAQTTEFILNRTRLSQLKQNFPISAFQIMFTSRIVPLTLSKLFILFTYSR